MPIASNSVASFTRMGFNEQIQALSFFPTSLSVLLFFFLSFCFLFLLIINKDSFSNSARTMVLQFSSFESTDGGWPMGSSCDGWNNPSGRQKYFFVVHHIVHWFPSAPCLLFQGTSCWHSWKIFLTFAEVFLPYPVQDNISFPLRFLFSHECVSFPVPSRTMINCQEMLSWDSSKWKRQDLSCTFPWECTRIVALTVWNSTFS